MKISSKNQNIAGVNSQYLIQKVTRKPQWKLPQPDKTGMHILLKLAWLVVILQAFTQRKHNRVKLLQSSYFAIVLNPLVTWFIRRGVQRPVAITIVVVVMLIALTALVGVLAASFNEFISMLPKFNKELNCKLLNCRRCCLFLICICRRKAARCSGWTRKKVATFTTALMTGHPWAMASVFCWGDDRSFMLL